MILVKFLMTVCLSLLCWSPAAMWAQSDLVYQNRGNRHEGIKPKPVSGYDIELISVLVDYEDPADTLPAQLKVKFYLDRDAEVHLTVRELDYKHYYWLDQVTPSLPWKPGVHNTFEWSAEPVLQSLDGKMNVYELGVLARVENANPSSIERVAPAILYHTSPPEMIEGYRFTLKTGGDARLSCKMFKEGHNDPIDIQVFRRKRGGRPFSVKWDAIRAERGPYKLVVSGFFLSTNERVHQVVHFFHQPKIKH